MIALEVGNMDGIITLLVLIMLGPPVLLTITGLAVRSNNPKTAKVLFILAVLYLIVGLGICGGLLN
jgi:hypothetical protein